MSLRNKAVHRRNKAVHRRNKAVHRLVADEACLVADEAIEGDNSATMEKLQLFRGDAIFIKMFQVLNVQTETETESSMMLATGEKKKLPYLPSDIWNIIREKLSGFDRISYNFALINRTPCPLNTLPWVFTLKKNCDKFVNYCAEDIYDPYEQKVYKIGKCILKPEQPLYKVHASPYGWLFVATGDSSKITFNFNVFNIFTKEFFRLPKLLKEKVGGWNIALNISTFPTSPDCIFFVVCPFPERETHTITISLYRIGDEEWTTYTYSECPSGIHDMIYDNRNRKLYCVFDSYELGVFEEAKHSWSILLVDATSFISMSNSEDKWTRNEFKNRLVLVNEEILLVHANFRWKPWGVYKFDQEKIAWVEITSIGNKAVFLGDEGDDRVVGHNLLTETSYSIPVDKSFAGRLYFNGSRKSSYYKLKEGSGNSCRTAFRRPTCKMYKKSTKEHRTRIWMYPFC